MFLVFESIQNYISLTNFTLFFSENLFKYIATLTIKLNVYFTTFTHFDLITVFSVLFNKLLSK